MCERKKLFEKVPAMVLVLMLAAAFTTCQLEPGTDDTENPGNPAGNPEDHADPKFHIYIGFGQSNFEGESQQGFSASTYSWDNPRFQVFNAFEKTGNGAQPYGRKKETWYTAQPPLVTAVKGLTPADGFGRYLVERLVDEDIKIGIIPIGIGGASLDTWKPDTGGSDWIRGQVADGKNEEWPVYLYTRYDPEGDIFKRMVELGKLAQKDGVIKGIIIHQGEGGGGGTNSTGWPLLLKNIYDRLLEELDLEPNSIPLLAGQTKSGWTGNSYLMKNLETAYPGIFHVIEATDLPTGSGDNVHFTSASMMTLGRRYGEKMLELQYAGYTKNPNIAVTQPETGGSFTVKVGSAAAVQVNASAKAGDVVTLQATHAQGYDFDSFEITGAELESDDDTVESTRRFIMPAGAAVTVTAIFVPEAIDTTPPVVNGISPAEHAAVAGSIVITFSEDIRIGSGAGNELADGVINGADLAAWLPGFKFGTSSGGNEAEAKISAASYAQATNILTLVYEGLSNSTSYYLTIDGICDPAGNAMVQVVKTFTTASLTQYTITVTPPVNGSFTVKVDDGTPSGANTESMAGSTITLNAAADEDYQFKQWSITGAVLVSNTSNPASFTMPATDVTVAAEFESVVVNPTLTFNAGNAENGPGPETVAPGGTVAAPDVSGMTNEGFTFGGWFTDTTLRYPVTFPLTVNEDTEVYAKWDNGKVLRIWPYTSGSVAGQTVYLTEGVSYTLGAEYKFEAVWASTNSFAITYSTRYKADDDNWPVTPYIHYQPYSGNAAAAAQPWKISEDTFEAPKTGWYCIKFEDSTRTSQNGQKNERANYINRAWLYAEGSTVNLLKEADFGDYILFDVPGTNDTDAFFGADGEPRWFNFDHDSDPETPVLWAQHTIDHWGRTGGSTASIMTLP
jgi:hypothetical protein